MEPIDYEELTNYFSWAVLIGTGSWGVYSVVKELYILFSAHARLTYYEYEAKKHIAELEIEKVKPGLCCEDVREIELRIMNYRNAIHERRMIVLDVFCNPGTIPAPGGTYNVAISITNRYRTSPLSIRS